MSRLTVAQLQYMNTSASRDRRSDQFTQTLFEWFFQTICSGLPYSQKVDVLGASLAAPTRWFWRCIDV